MMTEPKVFNGWLLIRGYRIRIDSINCYFEQDGGLMVMFVGGNAKLIGVTAAELDEVMARTARQIVGERLT